MYTYVYIYIYIYIYFYVYIHTTTNNNATPAQLLKTLFFSVSSLFASSVSSPDKLQGILISCLMAKHNTNVTTKKVVFLLLVHLFLVLPYRFLHDKLQEIFTS